MVPGALYLCDYGCALNYFLVMNGQCKGEVWRDWQADGEGVYPVTDATGKRLHLLEWCEAWLDE